MRKLILFIALSILTLTPAALVLAEGSVETIPSSADSTIFVEQNSDNGVVNQRVSSGNIGILSSGLTTGSAGGKDLKYLIALITDLINRIIPLIFAMAVVVILWGIAQSVSGSDEKRTEGKNIIIWGVVGLFAMVSIWGFVNVLSDTLKLDNTRITIPRV